MIRKSHSFEVFLFISWRILFLLTLYGCSKDEVPFKCGDPVEYDGREYNTVVAGTQCWFKENLNTGIIINGELEQDSRNSIIEKYCYNDDPENCKIYGGLYQWDEMMNGSTLTGSRGICPDHWHIPSDADWMVLFDFTGGRTVAGMKMKSIDGWFENGNGTDTFGLSILPGGDRDYDGMFMNIRKTAIFWSSDRSDSTYAWSNKFGYQHDDAFRNNYNIKSGFSVRCVRTTW